MKIFYSWQSDIRANRSFIAKCLDKAVAEEDGFEIETATRNTKGSPDIASGIFAKIDEADLFIADVSIINPKARGDRKCPNPNVMYELGYAIRALGEDNIILIANRETTDTAHLPFDIRNRRMILEDFEGDNVMKRVVAAITDSMRSHIPPQETDENTPIVFLNENDPYIKWANWGSTAPPSTGFRAQVEIDNYASQSNYITKARVYVPSQNWETTMFRIEDNLPNKPYAIKAGEMLTLNIILSDDFNTPRRMPDLDRDNVKLELTFRTGKVVTLDCRITQS